MAKTGKSKLLKSKKKAAVLAPVASKKAKKQEKVVEVVAQAQPAKKKVSEKLIESIERRRAQSAQGDAKKPAFGRPPGRPMGRRGRRPKGMVEYTPTNQDEEGSYVVETDYEAIEYDTGISVKGSKEDFGTGLDRFEDFDEELNFDW